MKEAILVFFFGGLGCSFRYAISKFLTFQSSVPLATLVVNVIGSLVLSYLLFSGEKLNLSPSMRVAITTGMLGGFTTFSTFSHQTMDYITSGNTMMAFLNILLNVTLCLVSSYLGFKLA
jgi:fluoride exporter